MADAKKVVLYSPTGTKVSVGEDRAEVLRGRGYTSRKPHPYPATDPEPNDDGIPVINGDGKEVEGANPPEADAEPSDEDKPAPRGKK